MILEPIVPTVLSVRRLPNADPALVTAYGGDPARHTALGLVTCDQDDAMYVALAEAPSVGKTIFEFDGSSRGAVDYALLAEDLKLA